LLKRSMVLRRGTPSHRNLSPCPAPVRTRVRREMEGPGQSNSTEKLQLQRCSEGAVSWLRADKETVRDSEAQEL
jgi:hypothetical protein